MPNPSQIPNFAILLGPFITPIPEASRPAFLCLLERVAAGRYREWADECPANERDDLLACSAREDEIADRVVALFPAVAGDQEKMKSELEGARAAYASVFEDLSLSEKLFVQAGAERQGAAAWRGFAAQEEVPAVREELERCAGLEEASAACLEGLLGLEEGATRLA
jgi:hypothetical protein